ncbi:MAG: polymerase sigma-70 factor [Chitinophagaceae bacterium]|nr:polymerase sigma-70 factor [Chitinophagaceae bacterium]
MKNCLYAIIFISLLLVFPNQLCLSTPLHNEKELLHRIAGGDEAAFTAIVDAYWNKIFSVALTYIKVPELAEDAVQEIFLKLWKNREKLREIVSLDNYLFIIIRNEVFSAMRKKGPRFPVGVYLENTLEENSPLPEQTLDAKQLQKLVQQAVELLPARQKEAWKLSREAGLSYEQIAEQMELSKNTVKIHLVKALNFLRSYIQAHSDIMGILVILFLQKK